MKKIINSATNEIFEDIDYSLTEVYGDFGTGNYWINDNYNIFAETGVDLDNNNKIERQYIILKLEQYDEKELVNAEYDYVESKDMEYDSLYKAVETLINNNKEIIL